MKTLTLALMSGLVTGIALADTVNFDDLKTGSLPPGWTATQTGKGDASAGKVGLWTKADSTTLFADFSYGPDSKITRADTAAEDNDKK